MIRHPWTTLIIGLLLTGSCNRTGDVLPPPSQRDCYTDPNALKYDVGRYWCRWARRCYDWVPAEEEAFKDQWEAACLAEIAGRFQFYQDSAAFWRFDPDPLRDCVDGCRAWPCIEALASLECTSDIAPQECFDMWGWTQERTDLLRPSLPPEITIRVGTCDNPVDEP